VQLRLYNFKTRRGYVSTKVDTPTGRRLIGEPFREHPLDTSNKGYDMREVIPALMKRVDTAKNGLSELGEAK